jgi:uncharacterized protein
MKSMAFLIFYSVVFTVFFLVHYYLYSRLSMVYPGFGGSTAYIKTVFWVLAFSFIAGRMLEKLWLTEFSMGLTIFGSYWLAAMLYFLLVVIFIDIIRLADYVIPIIPSFITGNIALFRKAIFITTLSVVGIALVYGHFNARKPVVRQLELNIPKYAGDRKDLNIVLVSDIHLGSILAKKHLVRIVEKINSLQPDIILLAGDVIDEDLQPVIRKDLGTALSQLQSKLGAYAVSGNHEYIGGIEPAIEYLERYGLKMLLDSALLIDDSFYLIGREDRDRPRFTGKPRKNLDEIIAGIDLSRPLILMDHQPFTLAESLANGIDLHLSGHTHNGQIWPIKYVINAIYEVGWGYKNKEGLHVYVSSGVGTWGPPVRIGTRPEIVQIRLRFDE